MREFETGANRDVDDGKLDFEGFLSPSVLVAFAEYMDEHRTVDDGSQRASDNWQKGMPRDAYMKSLLRHVMDLWMLHRGQPAVRPETGHTVGWDDALGGIFFNVQGYWHELLTGVRAIVQPAAPVARSVWVPITQEFVDDWAAADGGQLEAAEQKMLDTIDDEPLELTWQIKSSTPIVRSLGIEVGAYEGGDKVFVGGWNSLQDEPSADDNPHGGWFTRDQIKNLIANLQEALHYVR